MRRLMLALPLLMVATVSAPADELRDIQRTTYLRYCGACHGPSGQGDGVASSVMRQKPTDLTQLAKKAGGAFPTMEVMRAIDGTQEIHAHGQSDMPVWGEIFRAEAGDTMRSSEVRAKILFITNYLQSLQAK